MGQNWVILCFPEKVFLKKDAECNVGEFSTGFQQVINNIVEPEEVYLTRVNKYSVRI